jgi:hypothetical protein
MLFYAKEIKTKAHCQLMARCMFSNGKVKYENYSKYYTKNTLLKNDRTKSWRYRVSC